MTGQRFFLSLVSVLLLGAMLASGQRQDAGDMVARIRAEGLQRSRALALYRTLTDEIGARLTGSPAHMQAARWARRSVQRMGPRQPAPRAVRVRPRMAARTRVGRDDRPALLPLIAYADAWSPSTAGVVSGRAVYVGDKTAAQIQAMAAQLRGAIVLTHLPQTEFVDARPAAAGSRRSPGGHRATRPCRRRAARRRSTN